MEMKQFDKSLTATVMYLMQGLSLMNNKNILMPKNSMNSASWYITAKIH